MGPDPGRAASVARPTGVRDYLERRDDIAPPGTHIPQLAEVNALISERTGFSMFPAAGLVTAGTFLRFLGRDVFLATQDIRHHSRPLDTPEPDVVHELIGLGVTLGRPLVAELSRAFGHATKDADFAADRGARTPLLVHARVRRRRGGRCRQGVRRRVPLERR
ncbi:MAG: hypothetical protein CMJ83_06085 [Planctomycetes bacterium]|nr:hypothetical protein [Planctomycetota bacterium]